MIRFLRGKVFSVGKDSIVLDVGNLGFEIFLDEESIASLNEGDETVVYTYFCFGDDPKIYGFTDERKRELFIRLISVSKLGPKTALKLVSAGVDRIVSMIKSEDIDALSTLPGVGKKTAERIIVELKDKMDDFGIETKDVEVFEVAEALKALGFSAKEAYSAAKMVKKKSDISEMIKEALSILMEKK